MEQNRNRLDYFHFAEQDYKYLLRNFGPENADNATAVLTQNTCERYLKHIIDSYYEPETEADENGMSRALHTHDLTFLTSFIMEKMNEQLTEEESEIIEKANGYYFTTRYPGNDARDVTMRDMRKCEEALETARNVTIRSIMTHREMEAIPERGERNANNIPINGQSANEITDPGFP